MKEAIGGLALLEFLSGFYTYSLVTEMILVPIVTIIGIGAYLAEKDSSLAPAEKILRGLLTAVGIFLIFHFVHAAIVDPSIFSVLSLRQFLTPALLTALFVPLLYAFALYSIYSSLFWRLSIAFKDNRDLEKAARWLVIKRGGIRLSTARRLGKVTARKIWATKSIEDFSLILMKFNNLLHVKPGDIVKELMTGEIGEVDSVDGDFAKVKFPSDPTFPFEMWRGDLEMVSSEVYID